MQTRFTFYSISCQQLIKHSQEQGEEHRSRQNRVQGRSQVQTSAHLRGRQMKRETGRGRRM